MSVLLILNIVNFYKFIYVPSLCINYIQINEVVHVYVMYEIIVLRYQIMD